MYVYIYIKVAHYAFLNIIVPFMQVCNVAACEYWMQLMTKKVNVIWKKKKDPELPKPVICNCSFASLTRLDLQHICIMSAYGLHCQSVNGVCFETVKYFCWFLLWRGSIYSFVFSVALVHSSDLIEICKAVYAFPKTTCTNSKTPWMSKSLVHLWKKHFCVNEDVSAIRMTSHCVLVNR